jgi:hypothetical protein
MASFIHLFKLHLSDTVEGLVYQEPHNFLFLSFFQTERLKNALLSLTDLNLRFLLQYKRIAHQPTTEGLRFFPCMKARIIRILFY